MESKLCWKCGQPIDETNKSEEHVIPEALGGRLTSYDLLHRQCNIDLGILDKELEKQLHNLILLSAVRSKRNKNKEFVAFDENFEKVFFNTDRKQFHSAKLALIEGKEIFLTAPTKERLMKMVRQKVRQLSNGGYCDFDKTMRSLQEIDQPKKLIFFSNGFFPDDPKVSLIGGPDFLRAIAKIAVNFSCYKGVMRESMDKPIDFINGKYEYNIVRTYLPDYYAPYFPMPDELSHVILLKGSSKFGTLICYVELFNVPGFLVLLSQNYDGPDIGVSYIHNLVDQTKIWNSYNGMSRYFGFYFREFTQNYHIYLKKEYDLNFQKRYERIQRITFKQFKA